MCVPSKESKNGKLSLHEEKGLVGMNPGDFQKG